MVQSDEEILATVSGESTHRDDFSTQELDFELPEELIAQHPTPARDQARLLVLDRTTGALRDQKITNLPDLLRPGDLIVFNNTKVLPAKFTARRKSGGKVDGLFVRQDRPDQWLVMMQSSGRLKPNERLDLPSKNGTIVRMTILDRDDEGLWTLAFDFDAPAESILEDAGETPLPPYIRRNRPHKSSIDDHDRYQTVYAAHPGSVAAPTAGLHFTREILDTLTQRGIEQATLTLHVGIGTFRPVRTERLSDHKMHCEKFTLPAATINAVRRCKASGGRVIAVGTTTTRVLESVTEGFLSQPLPTEIAGETDIFIYPPRRFQIVDVLLTNFHLPRSTLLALVMAFAGVSNIKNAYRHAVNERYRFFSYGDAMLIL